MTAVTAPLDLRDYLALLWRRKWIIAAITIVTVGAALYYSYRQVPVYSSSSEVAARPVRLEPIQAPRGVSGFINMDTQIRIANSGPVAELAIEKVEAQGLEPAEVSASQVDESETIRFSATGLDPEGTQTSAQAWAEAYLEYRREQALADLEGATQPMESDLALVKARLQRLRELLAVDPTNSSLLARQSGLLTQRIQLEQALNGFVAPELIDVGEVLQNAPLPEGPSNRNHVTTGGLALLVGLSLGIGVAYLRDRLDSRVRGTEELEVYSGGPVLAFIPAGEPVKDTMPITVAEPASELSEAYKALSFRLLRAAEGRDIRSLVITSSLQEEGKSSTVANLGVAIAQAGHRVVLISADLRRPALRRFFPNSSRAGLVDAVAGTQTPTDALSPTPVPNLWVMHEGSSLRGASPLQLVSSDAMRNILAELREFAEYVLVDTPPLLAAFDAAALASFADGVLFVADAKRASGVTVEQARRELELNGSHVIGVAVNRYDPRTFGSYGYRYDYRASPFEPDTGQVRPLPPARLERPEGLRDQGQG